jgi:hypothetical protein
MLRWCWHDWSKWETYVWRGITYGTAGYLLTGDTAPRQVTQTKQVRHCLKCGKEIHRTVAEAHGAARGRILAPPPPDQAKETA